MTGTRRAPGGARSGALRVIRDDDTYTVHPVTDSLDDLAAMAGSGAAVLRAAERRPQILDAALIASLARLAERVRRDLERLSA